MLPTPSFCFLLCFLSQGSSNPPAWYRALVGGDGWEQAQAPIFKPSVSACTLRSRACTGLAACPMGTVVGADMPKNLLQPFIFSRLPVSHPSIQMPISKQRADLSVSQLLSYVCPAGGDAWSWSCHVTHFYKKYIKAAAFWCSEKRMLNLSVALRDCTCSHHVFTFI